MQDDSKSKPDAKTVKAEVDLYIREIEAKRRLRMEKIVGGDTGFLSIAMPFIIALLVGVLIYAVGSNAGMNGRFVSCIAITLAATFFTAQMEAWNRQKQIEALKEYMDQKLADLETRS